MNDETGPEVAVAVVIKSYARRVVLFWIGRDEMNETGGCSRCKTENKIDQKNKRSVCSFDTIFFLFDIDDEVGWRRFFNYYSKMIFGM